MFLVFVIAIKHQGVVFGAYGRVYFLIIVSRASRCTARCNKHKSLSFYEIMQSVVHGKITTGSLKVSRAGCPFHSWLNVYLGTRGTSCYELVITHCCVFANSNLGHSDRKDETAVLAACCIERANRTNCFR